MKLAHAMWTHGYSVQPIGSSHVQISTGGGYSSGAEASCVTSASEHQWFSFRIPTPVIVDDRRLRVWRVIIRFRNLHSDIVAISVYDGENRIAFKEYPFEGPKPSDTGWDEPHLKMLDVPGNPEIMWGLLILVHVKFEPHGGPAMMNFSAAGCDFI